MHRSLNRPVFFVPLAVLAATLAASLIGGEDFLAFEGALRDGIVGGFGWLFTGAGLAFLVLLTSHRALAARRQADRRR